MEAPSSAPVPISTYRYSSELGLWMGLYLFLMSACLLGSIHIQTLILLLFPLALGTPVVLYLLLNKVWRLEPGLRTLSAMWLTGIWTFIFGSLICAILSAGWILIFDPGFVDEYVLQNIKAMEQSPVAGNYTAELAQLNSMVEQGALPSPMQFIFTMIWSTSFAGSILSLLVALIFRAKAFKS